MAGSTEAQATATTAPRIVLVCTGVRPEEKMLVEAFAARSVELFTADDRRIHGPLDAWPEGLPSADAVILRAKSHWRNAVLARWIESRGALAVNNSGVIETCGDKVATTLRLIEHGVSTLRSSVSFSAESGRAAADAVGFPLVVKPVVGSWGRLIGKISDPDALETVLEHKEALGGAPHAVTYLQEFVASGGQDIRSFVVDGVCIAAIRRSSTHWRTNTALGATASAVDVDSELARLSVAAAQAVGGGAVAVDLFETDSGYVVNEVNGAMEFRNSVSTTGVDIPGLVADYVIREATARQRLAHVS